MKILECPSFPGYAASENGDVYTFRKRPGVKGGIRTDPSQKRKIQPFHHNRYLCVGISKHGCKTHSTVAVHRLVTDAFIGPKPQDAETRHLDGNPLNNAPSNLAYGTHGENVDDRRRHGRDPVGIRNPRAKLTEADVRSIRSAYTGKRGQQSRLAEQYGVTARMIGYILRGENWKHLSPIRTIMGKKTYMKIWRPGRPVVGICWARYSATHEPPSLSVPRSAAPAANSSP